ncbi:MAG: type VII secretion protein EssB [Lachnospiraceae bacterium]|nr:type VII secretion protein EssB [Lachnospiraceae bacterium]MDD7378891.1 type VII secretion protein EssB [Lachnospiraceae bacterium]MDY4618179.1 type VII secretion protein EssB [Lachnospiraceae bacterium]
MNEKENITKRIRKANMSAQDRYDWGKMIFPQEKCLQSSYEEEKEELIFSYDTEGYKPFVQIKKERREEAMINLLDCGNLIEVCRNYKVELRPENLYYDIHNQVFVMYRDVYGKGEEFDEEEFLKQYKALTGFVLQDKYNYEDYYDGGMELLQKDKFLELIAKADTVEEIEKCLLEEYERLIAEHRETKIEIDKKKYKRKKTALAVTSILLVLALAFSGYELFWMKPYERAVIKAQRDYLKINYSGVIEDFEKTDMSRLSVYDKYILAYSYIQCENLTEEQKKNINSALSLDTNEKILDYWIALGRLEVSEAENIAQQVSDNDLLLYAYLKEKNMLETDTEISGSEKEERMEELDSKIERLLEGDEDETEEETTEETTGATGEDTITENNQEGENGTTNE